MPLVDQRLRRKPLPDWLAAIRNGALPRTLPLKQLLDGSLYYPAGGVDGRPVQYLAGLVHSFVYVDYGVVQEDLKKSIMAGFDGYELCAEREVFKHEFVPPEWRPTIWPRSDETLTGDLKRAEEQVRQHSTDSYCRWFVFDRVGGLNPAHGPQRFSLLYLSADGAASYEPLYVRNKVSPRILALIIDGSGFGGNWTNFSDPAQFMHRLVTQNGIIDGPEYLLSGPYHETRLPIWTQYRTAVGGETNLKLWRRSTPVPSEGRNGADGRIS